MPWPLRSAESPPNVSNSSATGVASVVAERYAAKRRMVCMVRRICL